MALLGGKNWRDDEAVSFPGWREALEKVVTVEERGVYRRAILGFLHHCKLARRPATLMRAKEYVEACEKQENCRLEPLRVSLRWFFRTAAQRGQPAQSPVAAESPPPAKSGARLLPAPGARSRLRRLHPTWAAPIGSAI